MGRGGGDGGCTEKAACCRCSATPTPTLRCPAGMPTCTHTSQRSHADSRHDRRHPSPWPSTACVPVRACLGLRHSAARPGKPGRIAGVTAASVAPAGPANMRMRTSTHTAWANALTVSEQLHSCSACTYSLALVKHARVRTHARSSMLIHGHSCALIHARTHTQTVSHMHDPMQAHVQACRS